MSLTAAEQAALAFGSTGDVDFLGYASDCKERGCWFSVSYVLDRGCWLWIHDDGVTKHRTTVELDQVGKEIIDWLSAQHCIAGWEWD